MFDLVAHCFSLTYIEVYDTAEKKTCKRNLLRRTKKIFLPVWKKFYPVWNVFYPVWKNLYRDRLLSLCVCGIDNGLFGIKFLAQLFDVWVGNVILVICEFVNAAIWR